jgi:hypothetical protein
VAHSSERSFRIKNNYRDSLLGAAEDFYKSHSHLDITLALKNFDSRKTPVSKEVTSLVAIAVNLSRQLDEHAIRRVASSTEGMQEATDRLLRAYFRDHDERPQSAWSELSEAWQGDIQRRKLKLMKIFERVNVTKTTKPISAPLPAHFVDEIIALSRDGFAERFLVAKR